MKRENNIDDTEYSERKDQEIVSDQSKGIQTPPDKKSKMEESGISQKVLATASPLPQDSFSTEVEQHVAQVGEVSEAASPPTNLAGQTISLSHQVKHEVAIPRDFQGYIPLAQHVPSSEPAREYPFDLDPFQKLSIYCIQRNESVLVSAHTSAGKTVVAEYAIATALRAKQRVIYTSPIKALSNQKYREMQERFTDVGLMTGDVTLNQDASCLVMTTEILRSMLYRGSEIMREVSWVVFDEIHYMRDKERGVVWEETIILLPHTVRFVFLSATIPNSMQFARWICHIHRQPCHIVYTNYRPTPLQHYLFPTGADGIFLVVDEKGAFREENFRKALAVFESSEKPKKRLDGSVDIKLMPVLGRENGGRRRQRGNSSETIGRDLYKIIRMITNKNYYPVIVFSFSKRECEQYALSMSNMDFNTDEERSLINRIFTSAIDNLSEEDKELPQIASILPLLQRGIGIHHSGLLPILKEVIEIIFQEGLLKVLFATETFSIGLNMPAKTVVFTNSRKFDGQDHRWLSSGEYIQMSGRAGRRGLDTRGIVILMAQEQMPPELAKTMLKGQPDALNSAFHLSYNMILNLMRVEGVPPEFMLEKSFFQYQSGESIPDLEVERDSIMEKIETIQIEQEDLVSEYWNMDDQIKRLYDDYSKIVNHPSYAVPFLQPGRLIRIVYKNLDFGWCVVLNVIHRPSKTKGGPTHYTIDLLARAKINDPADFPVPEPKGDVILMPVTMDVVKSISSIRINLPNDVRPIEQKRVVTKTLSAVMVKFSNNPPLLDPVSDMKIKDESFMKLLTKIDVLKKKQSDHPLHRQPNRDELLAAYKSKVTLTEESGKLVKRMRNANSILQMDEMKCRKKILRQLGYVSESDVIEIKGRVACEISTGDELLLTEMIFSGLFSDLACDQVAALLSCFVFQEKGDSPKLREELQAPLNVTIELAKKINKVALDCKLPGCPSEETCIDQLRPELMEVVWQWCRGAKFAKICRITEVFEGSIIRCMRRLEELLRQMATAARTIGNIELETKFTETITLMKRDIVFASSLYL
jgi:ATP-dependent RNA helicase DOB1